LRLRARTRHAGRTAVRAVALVRAAELRALGLRHELARRDREG
jgi:hypothetical protein